MAVPRTSAASLCFVFFNDTATTEIYTLSLHDALPILADSTPSHIYEQDPCSLNVGSTSVVLPHLLSRPVLRLDANRTAPDWQAPTVPRSAVFCVRSHPEIGRAHV